MAHSTIITLGLDGSIDMHTFSQVLRRALAERGANVTAAYIASERIVFEDPDPKALVHAIGQSPLPEHDTTMAELCSKVRSVPMSDTPYLILYSGLAKRITRQQFEHLQTMQAVSPGSVSGSIVEKDAFCIVRKPYSRGGKTRHEWFKVLIPQPVKQVWEFSGEPVCTID